MCDKLLITWGSWPLILFAGHEVHTKNQFLVWFGMCSEGFLCAPEARALFLPQDVHIFLPNLIAVAGGRTNAMDVSENVRAWRCTRCPAKLQACCPGGGLLLLVAWASADVRKVLLQQPHARHPSPIPEGPCLGIVSLEAHSKVASAALCLSLSPGNDGVHMAHPLAWPTQLPGSSASPQRAGRWSPWTPEKGR